LFEMDCASGYKPPVSSGDRPYVLHVVPFDEPRGAQRYARDLVDVLESRGSHKILTLFDAEPSILNADMTLGVKPGLARRLGLDPLVMVRLRRLLVAERPVTVVAHGGEAAKYLALAAPRDIPTVYLRVGTAGHQVESPVRRMIHNAYVHRIDVMVAVSNDVARETSELTGIPADRIVVIPNARDPEVSRPIPPSSKHHPVRLIFVGHLDSGKRPDWFLDIIAELRSRGRSIEAAIVGDGPLAGALRARAKSLSVEMLGSRDDVAELLAEADILVFTSAPEGEGLPGVLIEAGLCGIPAVATRVPGASDVIEDGVTGFLAGSDAKAEMVLAIESLIEDGAMRSRMGAAARGKCVGTFTLESTSGAWEDLLTGSHS